MGPGNTTDTSQHLHLILGSQGYWPTDSTVHGMPSIKQGSICIEPVYINLCGANLLKMTCCPLPSVDVACCTMRGIGPNTHVTVPTLAGLSPQMCNPVVRWPWDGTGYSGR